MPKIEGVKEVREAFKKLQDKSRKGDNASVIVGYTVNYAVYVHEAPMKLKGKPRSSGRGRYWDPQGRAQNKFLEQPAREMGKRLGTIVRKVREKRGGTLVQGLKKAGVILQGESQKLVPVEYGALKASAFTAEEAQHRGLLTAVETAHRAARKASKG